MMSFLSFLMGSQTLRVGRVYAGELMNLCRRGGFVYRNLRFCGEHICMDASLPTAKKILLACQEHGISAVVERERGFPILLARYRHRYGLFVGLFCFAAIIIWSGQVLWGIRVDGNRALSDSEVISELQDCGLSLGCSLAELDTEVLENRVLIHSDEISWISINLVGTVAHVELREVEPIPPDEPTYEAGSLVAARSGQIELLENIRGNVAVKIGDVVKEGDLLVGGLYDMEGGGVRYRCASGEVYARTVREFLIEIPLAYEKKNYTGRNKSEKSLIFFGKEINFFENSRNLYATCDTIDTVEYLSLSKECVLPVGIRTVRYLEYEPGEATRDRQSAEALAQDRLRYAMESEVPAGALLRKRVEGEWSNEAYVLRCRAEYIENIAILKEIEIETEELS